MTMLINENRPVQTPKRTALKNIRIDDAAYDVVETFYPRQVLQLHLRLRDVMNIMNCSQDEALAIIKAIREYYNDPNYRLLVPQFCAYMEVDELWIQLFLAALKPRHKKSALHTLPEEQQNNGPVTGKQPLTLPQIIEKYKGGITYSKEKLREKAITWELLYPLGEPQFKKLRPYHVFIYPDEIAAIYKITIRSARDMLRDVRESSTPKMRRGAPVSIKKFCHFYEDQVEEAEIRKALASMYGEEE